MHKRTFRLGLLVLTFVALSGILTWKYALGSGFIGEFNVAPSRTLIPPHPLMAFCGLVGAIGFVIAYKRSWTVVIPISIVVGVLAITIFRLRDPLGISPSSRHYAETWDYLFWLS